MKSEFVVKLYYSHPTLRKKFDLFLRVTSSSGGIFSHPGNFFPYAVNFSNPEKKSSFIREKISTLAENVHP